MKIYLRDQKSNFKKHLDFLKGKQIIPYSKNLLTEKITTIGLGTKKNIQQVNLDFLFAYQIFPENIMTFQTEWDIEQRKMKVGDTIVQQVFIPPTKTFSQKIIFGVRINQIIDEADKKGFSYETLQGHVEKGISIFTIEQPDTDLIFKVQTYATPGNLLAKLLGPLFSIPYQSFCTKAALANVRKQVKNQHQQSELNSFEDYWKHYNRLIELLDIDNKQQIIIELEEARKYVNGLTDGWFEFMFAFEKLLNRHKNEMTAHQLDLADFLFSALNNTFTNR